VDGRVDDILYTIDGRRIGRLDPIFKGDLPVEEAQIIQEALDCVRVRYVPTPNFDSDHERVIIQRVQARMGRVKVVMEPIGEVPRGPNGKFRAVISNLSKEEQEHLKNAGSLSHPLSLPSNSSGHIGY
jgi:phenylacetate-CoA ligase